MSKASERWWELAGDDLRVAELVLREGIYHQACFHAQQCVEKALKGVLLHFEDAAPPRTHSVADLLNRVPPQWFTDLREPLAEIMDQFYIPTRYPDALPGAFPEGLPGKDDAEEAVSLARQVMCELAKLSG
jgi:HEPN domain-containing protein